MAGARAAQLSVMTGAHRTDAHCSPTPCGGAASMADLFS